MLSNGEKDILSSHGFTDREIEALDTAKTPGGNPQELDLNNPVWIEALNSHTQIERDFYDSNPGADEEDYKKFIDDWFRNTVGSIDPWIWIDRVYYLSHHNLTKQQYLKGYDRVRSLEFKLMK